MPALPQQRACSAGSTELEARDRPQEVTRLLAHPLGVAEMARLLEGDAKLERVELGRAAARDRLRDVEHGEIELGVLEVRAAAGGVRDDALGARGREGGRAAAREFEPLLAAPGVEVERSAAAAVGGDDLVAVSGQHARRGTVDLAEEHRLDAAGQEADSRDTLTRRPGSRPAGRRPRARAARAP